MKTLLDNLKRQLLADKKKLGIMVVMTVFGLLLWGRLLLKDIPRTASAEPRMMAGDPLMEGEDDDRVVVTRSSRVEIVEIDPSRRLSRDLFAMDANRYKRTFSPNKENNLFSQGNSASESTDETFGTGEVLERARELVLRSVITGWRPRAVINGNLLEPGDHVEGFELLDVAGRHVLLKRNGIVVRLWM